MTQKIKKTIHTATVFDLTCVKTVRIFDYFIRMHLNEKVIILRVRWILMEINYKRSQNTELIKPKWNIV